jgi:hypothetical protein
MKSSLTLAILPLLSAAYTVDPPSTVAPDTIEDCTLWAVATSTDTCAQLIEAGYGLTLEQFNAYVTRPPPAPHLEN